MLLSAASPPFTLAWLINDNICCAAATSAEEAPLFDTVLEEALLLELALDDEAPEGLVLEADGLGTALLGVENDDASLELGAVVAWLPELVDFADDGSGLVGGLEKVPEAGDTGAGEFQGVGLDSS